MPADPLQMRFVRRLYLSLALACACLIYAEWPFLVEMPIVAVLVTVLFILAYSLEGRWQLSLAAANLVGGLIGLGAFAWVALQIYRPSESLVRHLPFPASLLPYMGPLVLVLIPAKLLRPKHVGDYWGFQVIGLMAVALGAALAGDGWFGVLLVAYAVSVVYCLTAFHDVRLRDGVVASHPAPASARPIVWTAGSIVAALLLSLATPRITDARWELTSVSGQLHTGLADHNPTIDLNVSGNLKQNTDLAYTISAFERDGQPKVDLPLAQRWRAATFNHYEQGRWGNRAPNVTEHQSSPPRAPRLADRERLLGFDRFGRGFMPAPVQPQPVDFGARQYTLVFEPAVRGMNYIVADPVWLGQPLFDRVMSVPVITEAHNYATFSWTATLSGDLYPPAVPSNVTRLLWRQTTAPLPEADLSPPVFPDKALIDHLTSVNGLPSLRQYTTDLVRKLVADGSLSWSGRPGEEPVPSQFHETVARAFESHLLNSGLFHYSFLLVRQDDSVDPVEDFVLNVRQGHCNRFSSALALMLRCQGIPSRVVLGFSGAEASSEGVYLIRQSHAHSWVETLVQRPTRDGKKNWHWLALDPTPTEERSGRLGSTFYQWLEDCHYSLREYFRSYVLEYNAERQNRTAQSVQELARSAKSSGMKWLLAGAALCGLAAIARVIARRRPAESERTPFAELRRLIANAKLETINPGSTPGEMLTILARNAPTCLDPARKIVEGHHAVRFGGQTAVSTDSEQLATALTDVRRALKHVEIQRIKT